MNLSDHYPSRTATSVSSEAYKTMAKLETADKWRGRVRAVLRVIFLLALGGLGVMAAGWVPTLMGGQGVTW